MSVIDPDAFLRDGFTVVRGLFSPEEAEAIREETIDLVRSLDEAGEARHRAEGVLSPRGDMLTYEPLRRVLLDRRLIGSVAEVLGDEPVFWGESGVIVGDYQGGARSWHTDAYDTPVTDGPRYPLVRCGLYLQDTTAHSDGLALVAGSHSQRRAERSARNAVRLRTLPWIGARRTVLVESRPGDLVIWDMRILHAGEVIRFRPAPSFPVPLGWQGILPARWRMPAERMRVVMFPTFGLPGPDLDSYLAYQRDRDWIQEIWRDSTFSDSVVAEAQEAGLHVIKPVPYYGGAAAADAGAAAVD